MWRWSVQSVSTVVATVDTGPRCYEHRYSFTVSDSCGNSYETQANFVIKDTKPPSLRSLPHDMTVEDDGTGNQDQFQEWLAAQGGAVVPDVAARVEDGEEVTWQAPKPVERDGMRADGCMVSISFEFTAVDSCGNTVTIEATFTIVDTAAPRLTTVPSSVMLNANTTDKDAALAAWLASHVRRLLCVR